MKNPIITLTTCEEQQTIYRLLYALGYQYDNIDNIEDAIADAKLNLQSEVSYYPYVTVVLGQKKISGYNCLQDGYRNINSIGEFINYVIDNSVPVIKVKLNDEYSAVVTRENITVGCQKFTHQAIKELYEASIKINPQG